MTLTKYIIIDKKNEVYLKIEADDSIRRDLGEYFTFEVPGYRFTPQFRNRVWDGKIRLFSYATGQIYAGLYPYIVKWCEDNKIQVVDGTKIKDISVDETLVNKILYDIKKLEIRTDLQKIFTNLKIKDSLLNIAKKEKELADKEKRKIKSSSIINLKKKINKKKQSI